MRYCRLNGPTSEERGVEGWEERYVSEYAATATQEDFAETFMLFYYPQAIRREPTLRRNGSRWRCGRIR